MTPALPPGLSDRVWVVVRPSGERHFVDREPLEGIAAWAKGVDATITEYRFAAVVHEAPKRKKSA